MKLSRRDVKSFLDEKYRKYNTVQFIENDPILIPHLFTKKQDIEIMGFFAAILAWGQRTTIIKKCKELSALMDNQPYQFVLNHSENDLKALTSFKHRTFNTTDLLYFIEFFHQFYSENTTLEKAFISDELTDNVGPNLVKFNALFFSLPDFPERTKKHISSPAKNSACKRLNMFLRWMVRQDDKGVDFGIWKKIKPSQLICPCDVHVERVARQLGLIQRKQMDWQTAVELTNNLKQFDASDPVKYDFALFGLGVEGEL